MLSRICKTCLVLVVHQFLLACAGDGDGVSGRSDESIEFVAVSDEAQVMEVDGDDGSISLDAVKEMLKSYAPWEVDLEQEKLKELRSFVNWLDRQGIPLETIKRIVNWTQFDLEYSTLLTANSGSETWSHDEIRRYAKSDYISSLAGDIVQSKRLGDLRINPNGMLKKDAIDLMHRYYRESGLWTKKEYELIDSLRSEYERIEIIVPSYISTSIDDNILRICQLNMNKTTQEAYGPCAVFDVKRILE